MIDRFHYGVCYYPEHWPMEMHEADFRRIKEAGFDYVRMAEGAWAYFEPAEGKFQFDLFDRALDLCRKHGIQVIMGTPTYCAPAWVQQKYPEILRWDFHRRPMAHGSRRNFTYSSDKYIELSDRICTVLAEHFINHPQILGWQLDNEFNCHMDVSYAPADTRAFQQWLRKKYQSIERLNNAWGTKFWSQDYSAWEQVDLPAPTAAYHNPHQLLDESRFISDTVVAFARRQADILRKTNANWQITHNGIFGNINGPDLAGVLDFFCNDIYPGFSGAWPGLAEAHAFSRSLSFPFGILEQQSGPGGQMNYLHATVRPGQLRTWTMQSIAHGAKLLSFFLWRTCPYGSEQHWHGLLDHDNKDTTRLAEAKQLGVELRTLPPDYFDAPLHKTVAVLRDYDNEININKINTYARHGNSQCARWVAELSEAHIPVDEVWPKQDFSAYQVLIAPNLRIVTPEIVQKLSAAIAAGLTLVLTARTGIKDINLHMQQFTPPGLLAELAGVEIEDWSSVPDTQTRGLRLADGRTTHLHAFVEKLRPTTAGPAAHWLGDDPLLADAPAITRHKVGKGEVIYIGGLLPAATIPAMIDLLGLRSRFGADRNVEIIHRHGKSVDYVTVINHGPARQHITSLSGGTGIMGVIGKIDTDLILGSHGVAVVQLARG